MKLPFLLLYVMCIISNYGASAQTEFDDGYHLRRIYSRISAALKLTDPLHLESFNDLTDFILSDVKYCLKEFMEPLRLGDQTISKFGANLDLSDLKVSNLASMELAHDLQIYDNGNGDKTSLKLNLLIYDIKVQADYRAYFSTFILKPFQTSGKLTSIIPLLNLDFACTIYHDNFNITSDQIDVIIFGALDIHLGDSFIGMLAGPALKLVTQLLQDQMLSILGNPIKTKVSEVLKTVASMVQEKMQALLDFKEKLPDSLED